MIYFEEVQYFMLVYELCNYGMLVERLVLVRDSFYFHELESLCR
jgi:hypothetical protein